jgi:hypothetical protein
MIPPLIVFGIRVISDPLGWQFWSDVSNTGLILLAIGFLFWIAMDFLRIARVRRMMKAIQKRDINKIQKIANAGLKTRKWLRKFARKDEDELTTAEKSETIAKSSVKKWASRVLFTRKLSPLSLVGSVAASATIELARAGAGKITDAVDERLQTEFDNIAKTNTKTLLMLLIRDLLMGVLPIVFLFSLPVLLG